MKDETLAATIYHGFLSPKSRERQIDLCFDNWIGKEDMN